MEDETLDRQSGENFAGTPDDVNLSNYVTKQRFSGVQRKLNETLEELAKWKAQYADLQANVDVLKSENERSTTKLAGERDALTKQLEELRTQNETLTTDLAGLRSQSEMMRMIMGDYPSLAQDYADGLLRVDGLQGDDLTSYLQKYHQRIQGAETLRQEAQREGGSPPPPAGESKVAAKNADQLYDELMSTRPGTPEFRELQQQYYAQLEAEGD